MAVNQYFNWQYQNNEQSIIADIIDESIQNHGVDVKYLHRTKDSDPLFAEDPSSSFNTAMTIEMYVEDVQNFNGDNDLFSKFGLQMDDQATLIVSKRRFKEEVLLRAEQFQADNGFTPREGDLIYVPFSDSVWEIKQVKNDSEYFQQGQNLVFRLAVSAYEYSHEDFNTGDTNIDDIHDYSVMLNDVIESVVGADHDMDMLIPEKDNIVASDDTKQVVESTPLTVIKRK